MRGDAPDLTVGAVVTNGTKVDLADDRYAPIAFVLSDAANGTYPPTLPHETSWALTVLYRHRHDGHW